MNGGVDAEGEERFLATRNHAYFLVCLGLWGGADVGLGGGV